MYMIDTIVWCISISVIAGVARSQSPAKTNDLHRRLTSGYRMRTRPVLNQTDSVLVDVGLSICGIKDFNDLTGQLTFLSFTSFQWREERMTWKPKDYEDTDVIVFNYDEIWKPELTMLNVQDPDQSPGRHSQVVRVSSDGSAIMSSLDMLKTTCSIDMTNYPFDTQVCDITMVPWGYFDKEVKLRQIHAPVDGVYVKPQFISNNAWELLNPEVTFWSNKVSNIKLSLNIRRRYTYTFVNFLIPIYMLGFLNLWVFWLPPESGERTSYCITVFLSFAVYMTILGDLLQTGSEPLPTLNYLMLVMLFYSVAILFCTILSLIWYKNSDKKPVPACVKCLTHVLGLRCLRKMNKQVNTISDEGHPVHEQDLVKVERVGAFCEKVPKTREMRKQDPVHDAYHDITWTSVGELFDMYMFVLFFMWWAAAVTIQTLMGIRG